MHLLSTFISSSPKSSKLIKSMGTEAVSSSKLHIFFFPYVTSGHFIPLLNMASLFSNHPLITCTIITTPSNSHLITSNYPNLSLQVLPLPPTPKELPSDWDSTSSTSSFANFHLIQTSLSTLRQPLLDLLKESKPHCLISDMFLPWTADVAAEVNIPRVVFHGMSSFAMLAMDCVKKYRPQDGVEGEEEEFFLPGMPGKVVMRRSQLPGPLRAREADGFNSVMEEMDEAEEKSFGVVVNSFRELEGEFGEWHRKSKGGRVWHVGPVSLPAPDPTPTCHLRWLDSKKPGSVLYVCFGSQIQFEEHQLNQLATSLASSNHHFLWAIKKDSPAIWLEGDVENKKGIIIRGWVPQVQILNHGSIGGFLTHCGWNSVLEGVSAGKPMITWAVYGDQPFNEKLIVDELKIGARVEKGIGNEELVKSGDIARAVERVMGGGEEATEMKSKAKKFGEEARGAVKFGGSSWKDMNCLIEYLMTKGPMRV